LLKSLAAYTLPIEPVLAELQEYGWDAEGPLFTVTRQHVGGVLSRYLEGQLTSEQVTDWADLVECREDLGYEKGFEEDLKRTVFELANPNLTEPVSPTAAHAIRDKLS
jgi:hypothetical protein